MSRKRFAEEFKIEAARQITERGSAWRPWIELVLATDCDGYEMLRCTSPG